VGGDTVGARPPPPPFPQPVEQRAARGDRDPGAAGSRARWLGFDDPELAKEPARVRLVVLGPRQVQMRARTRDADVEEPSLLLRSGVRTAGTVRELPFEESGKEHRVELQALRAVV